MQETTGTPGVGELAFDPEHGFGHVMDVWPKTVFLRPPDGGKEWTAHRDQVRRATASEVLASAMRARGLLSNPDDTTP